MSDNQAPCAGHLPNTGENNDQSNTKCSEENEVISLPVLLLHYLHWFRVKFGPVSRSTDILWFPILLLLFFLDRKSFRDRQRERQHTVSTPPKACVNLKVDPCKKQDHIFLSLFHPSELSTVFKSTATEAHTGKLSSSYKNQQKCPPAANQSICGTQKKGKNQWQACPKGV